MTRLTRIEMPTAMQTENRMLRFTRARWPTRDYTGLYVIPLWGDNRTARRDVIARVGIGSGKGGGDLLSRSERARAAGASRIESGRGQPHSKTCRNYGSAGASAKRRGVRLPSAALA